MIQRSLALVVATGVHALHGLVALVLGLAGIVEGLTEAHVAESDWQLFVGLVVLGPALAGWTALASRSATTGTGLGWLASRTVLATLLLVAYAVAGTGALGLASTGGLGAPFMAAVAIGTAWLAIPETLIVGGAIALARRRRAALAVAAA